MGGILAGQRREGEIGQQAERGRQRYASFFVPVVPFLTALPVFRDHMGGLCVEESITG